MLTKIDVGKLIVLSSLVSFPLYFFVAFLCSPLDLLYMYICISKRCIVVYVAIEFKYIAYLRYMHSFKEAVSKHPATHTVAGHQCRVHVTFVDPLRSYTLLRFTVHVPNQHSHGGLIVCHTDTCINPLQWSHPTA